MAEMGDGAKAYINFLNQAIIDVQIIFKVELTKDEQMDLRLGLNKAINDAISKADEREDG